MARAGSRGRRGTGVTTARDPAFVAALRGLVRGEVRTDEPLARYSTYRIGGPATVLLPAVYEDVGVALRSAAAAGVPWFALGLGSNILLPDEGMDALVIRLGKGLDRLERTGDLWSVGCRPAGAARGAADGGGGLVRAAQVRRSARDGGWRRLHERGLPRRRVVGSRGVGVGGGRRRARRGPRRAPPSRSPTGRAASPGRWSSRPPSASVRRIPP